MPVFDMFMYLRLIFPFGDAREDVLNGREELRDAKEAVLNGREERRNAGEDVRDVTEEWRNAREDVLNHREERRNAREDGRNAIPERPKRPKTALRPPKMAVFEGNGGKNGEKEGFWRKRGGFGAGLTFEPGRT
jgi:hypothetical protein